MSLNCSFFLCRETPRRWSQRELCSHCKELHILQIHSHPTERPTEAGSTFKGGVMTVNRIGTFYDRRSIWNVTYSTGCGWGYPERGRECSPDGWVRAVRQRWQGAARICSACTQIRRSSGRVCDHIWPSIRHKKMNSRELSNILVWTFVSFELVWLLGRSAWWWPRTFAWSVYRQVSLFLCNVTYITNSQFKGHFTKKR